MNTEKDYSLLRPFDLEAAKAGEAICWHEDGDVALDVMFIRDRVVPVFENAFTEKLEQVAFFTQSECGVYLRMAPLCWVEGKPVYKGDVLYYERGKIEIEGVSSWLSCEVMRSKFGFNIKASCLTWTPPNVKREGWIAVQTGNPCFGYAAWCSHVCATKEQAEKNYGAASVVVVRIEWEEPAGGAA